MGKIAVHTGGGGGGGDVPYVVGTYAGSGTQTEPRNKYIDLGFRPTAVHVEFLTGSRYEHPYYGAYGGIALRGKDLGPCESIYGIGVHIESGGFTVGGLCNVGGEYYYIAFR